MVRSQVFLHILTYTVIAGLADKGCWDTGTSQRDNGVERRASGNGFDGLVAAEDDVEYGLAYSNYFSHIACKDTKKLRVNG
jgi:hypothetical protein